MITDRDHREFAKEFRKVVSKKDDMDWLDEAVKLIRDNVAIGDVFPEREIREFVADEMMPEDVFSGKDLAEWAEGAGYVRQ